MTYTEKELADLRQMATEAREARFVELGRRGANADPKHSDRAEWERLRSVIFAPAD